ncbi:hypothetical protein [Mucilaginibacter sp. 21P]|uniref:hypothetical protein n=1 Tax=Mucilaginibacter sp. 21P TaxID=2778902 RepID=UPI001C5930A6|nr:hypothetical protein [Mucilaginibacter sp. 21P]
MDDQYECNLFLALWKTTCPLCSCFRTHSWQKTCKSFNPKQSITAELNRDNMTELLDEMAIKHPHFYRYLQKTEIDQEFAPKCLVPG